MTLPTLLCDGARLLLGDRIGRGGEGEVYALADGSSRAVKLYLCPDAEREAKVRDIVTGRLGEVCANVAFPLAIVRATDGRFVGFTMRQVIGHQPIHELIATVSRRKSFPHADWRFLVRAALNVARSVASVHATGVVIGDINSAGFLVSQAALVTLIDADSFQVGAHRCRVGMPEYTPPELQGTRLGEFARTRDHDAFGLAVILFQLLALGRHPFAGTSPGRALPIDMAITQGRFAYSQLREVGVTPPPGALALTDLPRAIRLLFERAFAPRIGARPSASDWVRELASLEAALVPCLEQPHHHVASLAGPCPWCRIERQTGRSIFREGTPVHLPPVHRSETQLQRDVERAVRNAREQAGETITPAWSRPDVTPGKAARRALRNVGSNAGAGGSAVRALELGLGPGRVFLERHAAARVAAVQALDAWRTRLGIWDICKLSGMLQESLAARDLIAVRLPRLLEQASAHCLAEEVLEVMRTKAIATAQVAGIGSGLRMLLAKHGIRTAAEIARGSLAAVPGLGETRIVALLLWRNGVAVEAEQAIAQASASSRMAAAAARVDAQVAQLEASIRDRIANLENRVAKVQKRASQFDPAVQATLAEYDQAAADLACLGIDCNASIAVPTSGMSPAPPPPPRLKSKPKGKRKAGAGSTKPAAKTCPSCAAPMVERWAQSGKPGRSLVLGCSTYPRCNGTRPLRKKRAAP